MRLRWAVAAFLIVLAACSGGMPTGSLQGVVIENPTPKPSFVLTDTDGNPYDFAAETEGKVAMLFFGFTSCPDICPVHMAQLSEVFREFPALARNTIVAFVSIDPDRDTNEVLADYVGNFGPQFVGLSGTDEELRAAQEAAGAPLATVTVTEDDYTVNHYGVVYAYAPDGLNHTQYPFGTRQSVWANDLRILATMSDTPGSR